MSKHARFGSEMSNNPILPPEGKLKERDNKEDNSKVNLVVDSDNSIVTNKQNKNKINNNLI